MSRNHKKRALTSSPTLAEGTGAIHSNAFNFLSAVNTGVDPRTGMYSSSISLPGVPANHLCGPTLNLGLSFSALNPRDEGFGIGWSLTMTRYDTRRERLSLSSGESFRVDTFVAGKATFKDRKLRSFDLVQVSPEDYTIVHKSGMSEHLRVLAGSEGVAVLREVRSPEGHAVTLEQSAANGVAQLQRVIDGTGRVLIAVAYGFDTTTVSLHPETEQGGAFAFHFVNDRLERLALPVGYGDGWVFGYQETDTGLLLLTSTTVPTGGIEEVDYFLEGHALPGGAGRPLSHMPFVVESRRDPGHEQPVMRTRYAYSTRNFFGYGELDDWLDDEDNLYRVVMPPGQRYEYGSTETMYDGLDPVGTVERTFNRFHLLTSERSTRDGCVTDVVTVYEEDPGTSFENQVPWCQLPIEVRTRYYRETEPGRVREDVDSSAYDEHGNRIGHTDIHGTREKYTYYSMDGMEGFCPPDPWGFVRSVMEHRVAPPDGRDGPIKYARYRYERLPSRDPGGAYHVVPASAAWYVDDGGSELILLSDETYAFHDDGDIHHGRPKGTLRVVGKGENTTALTYVIRDAEQDARGNAVPVLVTTTTRIGSDGLSSHQATTVTMSSLFDGRSIVDESSNQVTKTRSFDMLGRIVLETASAGSDFAANVTTNYVLAHAGSWVETTEVTGRRTRQELDGFGREVRHVAENWMSDGLDHDIWRAVFNVHGEMASETSTDVGVPVVTHAKALRARAQEASEADLVLTTFYDYDGWGHRAQTNHATGVRSVSLDDPVSLVLNEYDEVDVDRVVRRTSHTRTTKSRSGKPLLVERVDAMAAQVYRTYEYDGLDRCTKEIDASGNTTEYVYDHSDRLVQTRLPDEAMIVRAYAKHSDEAWLGSVVVHHASLGGKGVDLGEQVFDGLGRRTLYRAGQRVTRCTYGEGEVSPAEIHQPSGDLLACTYQKYLGDRLVDLSSRAPLPVEHVVFEHDKKHGGLLKASSPLGTQHMEYFPSTHLAKATFTYDGHERTTEYLAYTLKGELTRFLGFDGQERRLTFDSYGRLHGLSTDAIVTALSYDVFGRLESVTTSTVEDSLSTTMRMEYDEHGRESRRTITGSTGGTVQVQVLSSTYSATDKLSTRTLETERGVREEAYEYDARGRLVRYVCEGVEGPVDASGQVIAEQRFTFDALDNIREATTFYVSAVEPEKHSTFGYAKSDPTQLMHIVERQEGRDDVVLDFSYDASGNLVRDDVGRHLEYDALGRLAGWTCQERRRSYRYDALDRVGCITDDGMPRYRYYEDGDIAYESGSTESSYHVVDGTVVAETTLAGSIRHVLLGSDLQGSVLLETSGQTERPVYTPYGYRAETSTGSNIAFAGEVRDRDTGWYLLGSYRAYNPRLMRFHSPDASCPFGKGGLNAYAYALGDPVNHVDPTGMGVFDVLSLVAALVGAVVTIGLMFWTAGTIMPAATAVLGAVRAGSLAGVVAKDVATTASTFAGVVGVGLDVGSAVETARGNDAMAANLAVGGLLTGSLAGVIGAGPRVAPVVAQKITNGLESANTLWQEAVGSHVIRRWQAFTRQSAAASRAPSPMPRASSPIPMGDSLRRTSSLREAPANPAPPTASGSSTAAADGRDPWRYAGKVSLPERRIAQSHVPASLPPASAVGLRWLQKRYDRQHRIATEAMLRRGSVPSAVDESTV